MSWLCHLFSHCKLARRLLVLKCSVLPPVVSVPCCVRTAMRAASRLGRIAGFKPAFTAGTKTVINTKCRFSWEPMSVFLWSKCPRVRWQRCAGVPCVVSRESPGLFPECTPSFIRQQRVSDLVPHALTSVGAALTGLWPFQKVCRESLW